MKKSKDAIPGSQQQLVVPRSVELMLDKYRRSLVPHKRKKLEVACVIHATDIKRAAEELVDLANWLREAGSQTVGHGSGYYMSIAYASCKRHNDQAHRSAPGVTVERKGNDGTTNND